MALRNFSKKFTLINNSTSKQFTKFSFANFVPKSFSTLFFVKSHSPVRGHANQHFLAALHMPFKHQQTFNSSNSDGSRTVKDLKLMDFHEQVWPNMFKSIRNHIFSFLIRSFMDDQFTLAGFLYGAEQAVGKVSSCISEGDFDALTGLAVKEIKQNYNELTEDQKRFIKIDPRDIFLKFVYEIGMIFEDDSNKRFVEITTIMQGFHGLEKIKDENVRDISSEMIANKKSLFICNYRFIKEFTRDSTDNWIINKLNHFTPQKLH